MRRLAAILAAILVITGHALADREPVTMYVICTPGHEINVRARATTHSDRTGYLCFADAVTVVDSKETKSGTWYMIDGVTEYGRGWVSGKYLLDDEPVKFDRDMIVRSNGRVALRDGVDGLRTGWAKPRERLHVICAGTAWAKTDRGYIRTDYLEEVQD